MDFSLSDEQAMLKESIEQYLEKSYSFEQRMEVVDGQAPFSADKWNDFAELGWLALPFDVDDEGFGGGAVEIMLIMQELGKHLVIEPYLASVITAAACFSNNQGPANRSQIIEQIISGQAQLALAFAENRSRFNLSQVTTSAVTDGGGFLINGEKIVVINGQSADHLIVVARTAGDKSDTDGLTIFCVEATAKGISRRGYKTVDGGHAAHIKFDQVSVDAGTVVGEVGEGFAVLNDVVRTSTLAICAEAVGIMDKMTQSTVSYTKDREQFGLPLSSFQALQHRMVEMFMELEQSRSLLLKAAIDVDEKSDQASRSVAALKYYIGKFGRKLGEEAVQLHGGMGVTYEMEIAHLFKRLTVIDTMFGNADYQLYQFMNH